MACARRLRGVREFRGRSALTNFFVPFVFFVVKSVPGPTSTTSMIESVHFRNFKVLREATLPLGRLTLLVGPNGSGKSVALQGLRALRHPGTLEYDQIASAVRKEADRDVQVVVRWRAPGQALMLTSRWTRDEVTGPECRIFAGSFDIPSVLAKLERVRIYRLDADALAAPVPLTPDIELEESGARLAGVLDRLRDWDEERFDRLNDEVGQWLPEYERVQFETPAAGQRGFLLRAREGRVAVPARHLSQGTLRILALLTLAHDPAPPAVICFEEPDRGIHPQLLGRVRDALYRLAYPESFEDEREPVQVMLTTQSAPFVNLFLEHPQAIVLAQKTGLEARFERLSDRPDVEDLLRETPLAERWFPPALPEPAEE